MYKTGSSKQKDSKRRLQIHAFLCKYGNDSQNGQCALMLHDLGYLEFSFVKFQFLTLSYLRGDNPG